jgi:hypothetical protein
MTRGEKRTCEWTDDKWPESETVCIDGEYGPIRYRPDIHSGIKEVT